MREDERTLDNGLFNWIGTFLMLLEIASAIAIIFGIALIFRGNPGLGILSILMLAGAFELKNQSLKYLQEGWRLGTFEIHEDHVNRIVMGGPYKYVRHPWYLANIVHAVAISLIAYSYAFVGLPVIVIAFVAVLGLIFCRVLIEESFLLKNFPEYGEYRLRVRGFIPFVV